MPEKILCVDDEPNILNAYKRALRGTFLIETAAGGAEGLAILKGPDPFAVVVSDMRMPGMDGVEFLREVKQIVPDTVRIMLTGNGDQQTAIDAVNRGSIFRFLTKPCSPEDLSQAIDAAIQQYRLVMAEKELLLAIAGYNLVRSVQMQAAREADLEPRRLSFSRVQAVVMTALPRLATLTDATEWEAEYKRVLGWAAQGKLPNRTRQRSYPRAVWGRGSTFPKHQRKEPTSAHHPKGGK